MSRIGSQPIIIPKGVDVKFENNIIKIKGPKGELKRSLDNDIAVKKVEETIIVDSLFDTKASKQKWGLFRSLVNNMVVGVTEGFSKTLNIEGVGYKAVLQNKFLTLSLGYSHDIKFEIPESLEVKCPKPTIIELRSFLNLSLRLFSIIFNL